MANDRCDGKVCGWHGKRLTLLAASATRSTEEGAEAVGECEEIFVCSSGLTAQALNKVTGGISLCGNVVDSVGRKVDPDRVLLYVTDGKAKRVKAGDLA